MATETHGGEAESAAGMPQLEFSTFPNQIFWLIVALVAIYFIVTKVAMPRIGGVIGDRHEVISNDLETAADLKTKAEAAEAAYEQALADARAEALSIAADTKAEIQKELAAATEKADAEIAAKTAESQVRIDEIRASAIKSIEEVAGDTGATIVEALLPDAADAGAVKDAVAKAMKG